MHGYIYLKIQAEVIAGALRSKLEARVYYKSQRFDPRIDHGFLLALLFLFQIKSGLT
jgi:hypothetical protein